jgi:hypothetical protein
MAKSFFMLCLLVAAPAIWALQLKVEVLDAAAAPVEEARVWVVQDQRVFAATTDKEGILLFEDLAVGETVVVALKPGLALDGQVDFLIKDGGLQLDLGEAESLRLGAVNGPDSPVAGAEIKNLTFAGRFVVPIELLTLHGFPRYRSDDQGQILLPHLPKDTHLKIRMAHPRYADAEVDCMVGVQGYTEAVFLGGIALRGRVTMEEKAATRARVAIFRRTESGQRKYAEVFTDPEGFYRLQAGRGHYSVAVGHPELASPAPVSVNLQNRNIPAVVDLQLLRPRRISGRILFPNGDTCVGARVTFRVGDVVYADTFTGLDGRFEARVGPEQGILTIFSPTGFTTEVHPEIPVAFGDVWETSLEDIRLKALPKITGQVLDNVGAPLARALVSSMTPKMPFWTTTDEEGRFGFQLGEMPVEKKLLFRAESRERFLRRDFKVTLKKIKPATVELKRYDPNDKTYGGLSVMNNLSDLARKPAPKITAQHWFNGAAPTRESLQGKVIALTFWNGFSSSRESMQRLTELKKLYHLTNDMDDVLIMGIHDGSATVDEVGEQIALFGVPFLVGLDTEDFETFLDYHINSIPQTVLINKKGAFVYYHVEGRLLELIKVLRRQ